jgi:hypothetical protein
MRAFAAPVALLAAALAVLAVHGPVLDHYFFGDDFVPLGEAASKGTGAYARDLFLLDDVTPNWRFLPGLFYLGAFRAFGLDAFPFLLVSVLVHIGTAALIFWLVYRAIGAAWPAFLASASFGLTAAHAPTVAQVTAFNNVLAAFLVMLSLVTLYEGLERRRLGWWGAASVVSFAGAVASNESTAVLAPVPALLVLWKLPESERWWEKPREWRPLALPIAPYALIGGAALIGFGACRCTEAASVYSSGDHAVGNLWIYLGRLLYPIGLEFPGQVGTAHLVAGLVVAGLALAMLARGSTFARICVAFLALAILPYLPIGFALAMRYVYLAAIPFSILAALLFVEVVARAGPLATAAAPVLAVLALGVMGLYGWQTWSQNQFIADGSAQWRTLVDGLEERYPELPEGSRVIVRGGPHTDALWQFFVLPSVGEVVWGGVQLFSLPQETERFCAPPAGDLYVVDYDEGSFAPAVVTEQQNTIGPGALITPDEDAPPRAIVVDCRRPGLVP